MAVITRINSRDMDNLELRSRLFIYNRNGDVLIVCFSIDESLLVGLDVNLQDAWLRRNQKWYKTNAKHRIDECIQKTLIRRKILHTATEMRYLSTCNPTYANEPPITGKPHLRC
ncbi:hypothetical protein AVEN_113988-1 [Araneus ventricosus]|uniref:Uncharacterized protein n=1 Tax=Araneus ventricosus TaxID=182803 RepID=A0A4Y2JYV4_ARAVE|nr:hypothetical protein AVEN_113988-1 [Araneus ventricosus]